MKVIHTAPGGPTVYITDLGLRLGQASEMFVPVRKAAGSADLVNAIERNLVRIKFTAAEGNHPDLQELLSRVEQAEAKREGQLLYAKVKETMETGRMASSSVPVRPAVLEPVTP